MENENFQLFAPGFGEIASKHYLHVNKVFNVEYYQGFTMKTVILETDNSDSLKFIKEAEIHPFLTIHAERTYFSLCTQNYSILIIFKDFFLKEFSDFFAKFESTLTIPDNEDTFRTIQKCFNYDFHFDDGYMFDDALIEYESLISYFREFSHLSCFFQIDTDLDFSLKSVIQRVFKPVMIYFVRRNFFSRSLFKYQHFPTPETYREYSFDEFVELRFIGSGSYGNVSMCFQKSNGYIYAIKMYFPVKSHRKLFHTELKSLRKLNHPCIVKVYGYILQSQVTHSRNSIILEFMPHGSVKDILDQVKKGKPPPNWRKECKIKIISCALFGLDFLHSKGIIHRDVKMANVIVDSDFSAKLTDFDSSKHFTENPYNSDDRSSVMYYPPETTTSNEYTFPSDLYSFGLFIYELITEEQPFYVETSLFQLIDMIQQGNIPVLKDGPKEIIKLYMACVGTDPSIRCGTFYLIDMFLSNLSCDFGDRCLLDVLISLHDTSLNRQDVQSIFKKAEECDSFALFYLGSMYFFGYFVEQKIEEAIKYYEKSAMLGNVHALFNLGLIYSKGQHVEKDEGKASEYFVLASELGHLPSLFSYGVMLCEGRGVAKDLKKAYYCFLKSADLKGYGDNTLAMFNVGCMLEDGRGVSKNLKKAKKYYKHAANKGHSGAQVNLGNMYAAGRGCKKKPSKALHYYKLAAEQDNPNAYLNLGNFAAKQRREAEAIQYYENGAKLGNTAALFNLGVMYVNIDPGKATEYFHIASDEGHSGALYNLGKMYMNGIGVAKNVKYALECFEKAASLGNSRAIFNIGLLFLDGIGVAKNEEIGFYYLKQAAFRGHIIAIFDVGNMLELGIGVMKNEYLASEFFYIAALERNPEAMYHVGKMLQEGRVLAQDKVAAFRFFQMAGDQGHINAILECRGYREQYITHFTPEKKMKRITSLPYVAM